MGTGPSKIARFPRAFSPMPDSSPPPAATPSPPAWARLLPVATVVLVAVAAAYLTKGFTYLILTPRPSDLNQRWEEIQWLFAGEDPWRGHPRRAPYPPFAYPTLLPLVWPPYPVVRAYFAAANVAALAVIVAWAVSVARTTGRAVRGEAAFLAASVLAVSSTCTTLGIGQLGVIVTALLAGTFLLQQRDRPTWAGLLFGMALVKPTISGLFVLPLLCKGGLRPVVVAAAYVLAGSAVVLARAHESPVAFLHIWREMADRNILAQGTGGLIDLVTAATGLAVRPVMTALGAIFTAATVLAAVAARRRPMPVLLALAAVGDRLWSYHTSYDNVMLVFLLVPLAVAAVRTGDRGLTAAFAAVAVSLWLPAKATERQWAQLVQVLVWVAAAIVLATSAAAAAALSPPLTAGSPDPSPVPSPSGSAAGC